MVDIGISQPINLPLPLPSVSTQAGQGSQVGAVNGQGNDPEIPLDAVSAASRQQGAYDPHITEQTRANTVKAAAQQIANPYVVSDQEFTIFKDSTGQYITRFISLRDGKVTYIPEPTLYTLGGSSNEPSVQIKA